MAAHGETDRQAALSRDAAGAGVEVIQAAGTGASHAWLRVVRLVRDGAARPSSWIALLALVVLFVAPLWAVATVGLSWKAFAAPAVVEALRFGLLQASLAAVAAVAAGFGLAVLHRRVFPGRRFVAGIHAMTFVLPVFVVAFGLQALLGGQGWLASKGIDVLAWLGPTGAVVLAHAYYNHGFAALLLGDALSRRSMRLREAAQTLGAPPAFVRWRIELPLLAPAILSTFLLVFLFSFTAFGTVLVLGQAKVANLQMVLYGSLQGIFPRPDIAASAGILELLVNGLLLLGAFALRRRFNRQAVEPEPLEKRATVLQQFGAYFLAAVVVLPVLTILVQGFRLRGEWSLAPWRSLLLDPPGQFDFLQALGNSVAWAAASSLLAAALVVAWLPRRRMEWLASLPLAVSPLFLGIGMLALYGPAGFALGRPYLLILGHTALVFPFVARMVLPTAHQADATMTEAARVLGAPPRSVLWRVQLPLVRPLLVTAAGLGAAMSLGDLSISTFLSTVDTNGISVWIQRLDGPFDPMRHARAVALTGFLALLVITLFAATRPRRDAV